MKNDLANRIEKSDSENTRKLLAFLWLEVDALIRKNKFGLAENYQSSGRSFQNYLATNHKTDIPLRKVDEELLFAYQQWLQSQGVTTNTPVFFHLYNVAYTAFICIHNAENELFV